MWKLWKYIGCILTVAVTTAITVPINDKDIIDTVAGGTFVIRTWTDNASTLSLTIAKDNKTVMTKSFEGSPNHMVDNITGHWNMKSNDTTKEISLLICNISRHDEGLYHIVESIHDSRSDPFERKIDKWSFQLNVLDTDEITTSSVGKNVKIKGFQWSDTFYPRLYYYDQLVATLYYSECNVMTTTHLYGRLNYTENNNTKTYRIEIQNVTQRDTGLYKVMYNENNDTERCFINITENPIYAIVGDNATISWYYNQQGMNRTLRIIHPNDGIMIILPPSNNSTTRTSFQNRASYNGIISRSYMSFNLCNLSKSDTGMYRIETQHGNSIPGGKQLIVEDCNTTSTQNICKLYNVSTEIPVNSSNGKSSSLHPAVGASIILLVIGCLLWNQRKRGIRKKAALPSTSASVDTACEGKYSLTQSQNDAPRLRLIANYNESIESPNKRESVGYAEDIDYDILDSSPSVCTLAAAKGALENSYNCIYMQTSVRIHNRHEVYEDGEGISIKYEDSNEQHLSPGVDNNDLADIDL